MIQLLEAGQEKGGYEIKMAVVMINIIPLGTNDSSVSKYVAKAIKVLQQEKVTYEATSMGTTLEGELDEILPVCRKMHEAVFDDDMKRVVTIIRIDDRRDKQSTIRGKMQALEEELTQ